MDKGKYFVISMDVDSINVFEHLVNVAINDGYRPIGGVAIISGSISGGVIYQAMCDMSGDEI